VQSFHRRLQVYPKSGSKQISVKGSGSKSNGMIGAGGPAGGVGGAMGGDLGSKISLTEIAGLYQHLSRGQLAGISDIQSSITNLVPQRLMQQLRLQALLAAPIIFQGELLGFIAVEMTSPRLWSDPEKQYLQSVAQLLGLIAPLETVESIAQQSQQEQQLLNGLTQTVCHDQTWKETLHQASEQLCHHLHAERLFLLKFDPLTQGFQVYFQNQLSKQRPFVEMLRPLTPLDLQTLAQTPTLGVDNLQEDLRFAAWRDAFLGAGIRSFLICNMTPASATLDGLLLLTQETPRHWGQADLRIAASMAQQLGLLNHQWQLQAQSAEQQSIYQTVQRSLSTIEKTQNRERLELAALKEVMQALQVPLAALVTWHPGHQQGWVVTPENIPPKFSVQMDAMINVESDPLIQAALDRVQQGIDPSDLTAGIVTLQRAEIPAQTKAWLCGAEIGQVMAIALQTDPEYQASGVVVVADRANRTWSALQLDALSTLIRHFAWAHRSLALTQFLQTQWQNLECLNWYKHRRLEELYRNLAQTNQQLLALTPQLVPSIESQFAQVLKQMHGTLATVPALLKKESWRLKFNSEPILLVSLIKRSVHRLESVIKQNQLRIQVHSAETITVTGDIAKIDLLIYELLLAASHRLAPEGRIDIWCQPLEAEWVEISITDNGAVEAQLLIDLHHRAHQDLLAPSSFDRLPGRHLKVCQLLAEKLKGEVDIYKLEDGRTLSRLVLPLQS
jgi:GAF domain-containing protein